jgi:hypothetical protein
MPAFGQALTIEQIERTINTLVVLRRPIMAARRPEFPARVLSPRRRFRKRGVITTGVTTSGPKSVTNQIVYERRIGSRGQYEVSVPIDMQQAEGSGSWNNGIGDIELALRRTFFHNVDRGSIFAAGAAVALPTGSEERGLGNGYTIVEPFAMFGRC